MKKALINSKQACEGGWVIAQICDEQFDVHPDLYWVAVDDDIMDSSHYWDGSKPVRYPGLTSPDEAAIEEGEIPVFRFDT